MYRRYFTYDTVAWNKGSQGLGGLSDSGGLLRKYETLLLDQEAQGNPYVAYVVLFQLTVILRLIVNDPRQA